MTDEKIFAISIRTECDELAVLNHVDDHEAATSAEPLNIGKASPTPAIPNDEACPRPPRHLAILPGMRGSGAPGSIDRNLRDRPMPKIVSRRCPRTEDSDIPRVLIGEELLHSEVRTSGITNQDRQPTAGDDGEALRHG